MIRVAAAALMRDALVLAARRTRPAHLAGGWEFPGGKVEDGESDADALVRELREELGVTVDVGPLLAEASEASITLALLAAEVVDGEPVAGTDHDELRWVTAAELDAVAWLPIDARLLDVVRAQLGGRSGQ